MTNTRVSERTKIIMKPWWP